MLLLFRHQDFEVSAQQDLMQDPSFLLDCQMTILVEKLDSTLPMQVKS